MKLFCLIFLSLVAAASAADSAFQTGNRQFAAGDFAAAAASYEQSLKTDGPDAAALYNLGNALLKQQKYGPAILAYERAKLLAPRDPDLKANLAQARKAATAFEESPPNPRFHELLHLLSLNEWSWLVAGGALALGGLSLAAGAVRIAHRGVRRGGWAAAGVAALAVAAGTAALVLRRDETARGIVVADSAAVRLSPFESAEALGTPVPGRTVRLGERNGAFRYIEAAGGGLAGWIDEAAVAAVIPER